MILKLVVPGSIEDAEELRVLEWHGTVGQRFAARELIVELETHKAVVEIRAAQQAILRRVLAEAGSWQKPGDALALLSDEPTEPLPATATGETLLVEFEVI
ncbi:MAG TPA: lipoyl domain-containing protein [Casimicrobiaceae bacterium]|nr:lipoyl domain-containing protein [Casimicrobiaceae bacterium]